MKNRRGALSGTIVLVIFAVVLSYSQLRPEAKPESMSYESTEFPLEFPMHPQATVVMAEGAIRIWNVQLGADELAQFYRDRLQERFEIVETKLWQGRVRMAVVDRDGTWKFGLVEIVPRGGESQNSDVSVVLRLDTSPVLSPAGSSASMAILPRSSLVGILPADYPADILAIPSESVIENAGSSTFREGNTVRTSWVVSLHVPWSLDEITSYFQANMSSSKLDATIEQQDEQNVAFSFKGDNIEGNIIIGVGDDNAVNVNILLDRWKP